MTSLAIVPGYGVGFLRLGAALFDILTALKADVKRFPKLDVSYSTSRPLALPVVVDLPDNGIRLRCDGPQQRLRLIEILDLAKHPFTVKGEPLLPATDLSPRLVYRRAYSLFGASYPGELVRDTYVVSYPGIALNFPIQSSTWSSNVDHAKMLTDSGTAVSSIAVFEGKSWAEARADLWTRPSTYPQHVLPVVKHKEGLPDEIDTVQILSSHKLQFSRRSSFPVSITLGETSAQDLVTDFGPPDTVYKRPGEMPEAATRPARPARRRSSSVVPRSFGSTPSSISSTNTDTYDADFEEDDGIDGPDVVRLEDQYYCYFSHGVDILLSVPQSNNGVTSTSQPVVTRVIFHGNIPGSFEFNRRRRSRWSLECITSSTPISSESQFSDIHDRLISHFKGVWPTKDMKEGMVIVRDWAGESPSGSAILIGEGADEQEEEARGEDGESQWLKNTQLFKFPGLMFEVMHNGGISALTVYGH